MPFPQKLISILLIGVTLVVGLPMLVFAFLVQTDAGYTYVFQNTCNGDLEVVQEPGYHARWPWCIRVTEYKQVMTVAFQQKPDGSETRTLPPIQVQFADTYLGFIPATFRLKLPAKTEDVLHLHREFRTFGNLVDAMLVKQTRNIVVITATQYTGEEFFQGGLNDYKSKLDDQLRNGAYITARRQVEVQQTDLAPVSGEQTDQDQTRVTNQLVWKTVPLLDANGQPQRQRNPLDQYGIEVTQVTVATPTPEDQLFELLKKKKDLVAKRIQTIQEQDTAREEAKTAQIKKEIERRRLVADANRERELAVISQQKAVEVARELARKETVDAEKLRDLAVIERDKALKIAQANRDIESANAEAARFKAEAIKAEGLAKAEVVKAEFAAKGAFAEIFLAEVQRDTALALYRNMKGFKVEMPQFVMGGGGNGGIPNNLEVLTTLGALEFIQRQAPTPKVLEVNK